MLLAGLVSTRYCANVPLGAPSCRGVYLSARTDLALPRSSVSVCGSGAVVGLNCVCQNVIVVPSTALLAGKPVLALSALALAMGRMTSGFGSARIATSAADA